MRFVKPLTTVLICISLWLLIVVSQNALTTIKQKHIAPESMAFVPQTEKIKPFLFGFHSAYADYLWIRTTLYFGGHFLTDQQYPWLVHMVDLVTRINPNMYPAYEFAGLMLPDICKDPNAARIILERGVTTHVERKWKLYYYLGMIYYRYFDDRQKAAECIAIAATQKNSPAYRLAGVAAALFKKAGKPEEGKEFLELSYALSENPEVKRFIQVKIGQYLQTGKN